ncbi:MAG: sulfatase-like hydrolase/transferase [Phycisphaerae bacterium]|jgi:arylsulfatase A-like enzyme/Flp pilus assembly protein TadD
MRWNLLAAGALLAGVLLVGACDRPPAGSAGPGSADHPNVLLITLDTTRADHLGCYGHTAAQTPVLDKLAAGGVRCERAYCQAPLTLPSHTALLTSSYPPANGIRMNGGGVVAESWPTLAEQFHAHEYRTGAFIAAWVLHAGFGLNRGFDRYDDELGGEEAGAVEQLERRGDDVCDRALAWLAEQPGKPFFAWVHFFDPHHPYAPPAPYDAKLADPYDGEIAFMDAQVGRLVAWLEEKGLRERTLIVVVGDHGEAFGEHGETEHGLFLYDTTLRVPLIFSFPSRVNAGHVVAGSVRLVDIAPTVLELLGWPLPAAWQGESLRSALAGKALAGRPVYGETQYPRVGFGWAPLRCCIMDQWKYIDAPRPELYDWRADPAEETNVLDAHADVAAQLRAELADLVAGWESSPARQVALDAEDIQALESLGYVGVAGEMPESDTPRRDAKDMVDVHRGLLAGRRMLTEGRSADVVALLEPLAQQSPESDELHAVLGEAYLKLQRFADAEREYRDSLRSVATNARKWCRLGDAVLGQQRVDEALACYQRAADLPGEYGPALSRLGALYARRREFAQAEPFLRRRLALEPHSPGALVNLANVLGPLGRREEAVRLARQALTEDPRFTAAHRFLWQVLVATHKNGEAIEALRAAVTALPEDVSLRRQLATLLAMVPEAGAAGREEALALAEQCVALAPQDPECLDTLSIVHGARGDVARALELGRQALALAQHQGKRAVAERIAARLRMLEGQRRP